VKKIQQIFSYPFSTANGYYVYFPMKGVVFSVGKKEYYSFLLLTKKSLTKEDFYKELKKEIPLSLKKFNSFYKDLEIFLSDSLARFPTYTMADVRREIGKIFLDLKTKHITGRIIQPDIVLFITGSCNLRCLYCSYKGKWYGSKQGLANNTIPLNVSKKAIRDFLFSTRNSGQQRVSIVFYGGEPLLEFNLIKELISFSEQYHIEIKHKSKLAFLVVTNGIFLNQERIMFFIKKKIGLQISIDGPQKIHDRNRRDCVGKGSYKKIVKNIKLIKMLAFKMMSEDYYAKYVSFNAVYVDYKDKDRIESFFQTNRLFKSLRGKKNVWTLSPIAARGLLLDSSVNKIKEKKDEDVKIEYNEAFVENKIKEVRKELASFTKKGASLYEKNKAREYLKSFCEEMGVLKIMKPSLMVALKQRLGCIPWAEKGRLTVLLNGNIAFCGNFTDVESMYIGNYRKNGLDFKKIKNLIFQYRFNMKKCYKCPFLMLCTICFRKGSDIKHNIYNNPLKNPALCLENKRTIAGNFYVFYSVLEKIPELRSVLFKEKLIS